MADEEEGPRFAARHTDQSVRGQMLSCPSGLKQVDTRGCVEGLTLEDAESLRGAGWEIVAGGAAMLALRAQARETARVADELERCIDQLEGLRDHARAAGYDEAEVAAAFDGLPMADRIRNALGLPTELDLSAEGEQEAEQEGEQEAEQEAEQAKPEDPPAQATPEGKPAAEPPAPKKRK